MKQINMLAATLMLFTSSLYADVTPGEGINLVPPALEHVLWQGIPIAFSVPVGEERLIRFPGEVEFKNTDPRLTSDKVAITNNKGTLYIKALQAFDPIRVYVQVKDSGEIVYLDLAAAEGGDDTPVQVMTASPASPVTKPANPAPDYISLLQYAVAQVYWPERLLAELNHDPAYFSFARTPMYTTRSVHLILGSNVIAMPQVGWRSGDLFVTEVLLLNPNKREVDLDPFNNFAGNWVALAFYPTHTLAAQGTAGDRSTVFLVSDQPFNTALSATPAYRMGESS